jgi:chaperonin GroES
MASHMSWQLMDQMDGWEEGMDRLLITLPFTGTEFKKTYFDPEKGTNVSEHVFAKDLVINFYAKTLEQAPRITEMLYYSKNELQSKYLQGLYLECKDYAPRQEQTSMKDIEEKSKGVVAPPTIDDDTPFLVLEQHRFYDLDGDGYSEPYICTVLKDSRKVLRIVAAYYPDKVFRNEEGKVAKIERITYYTKYVFIPNPAGGIYGIGFGDLLGPLNHSVDTLINQLIDAGTASALQSGFISRNLRIKGGDYKFRPNQWMNVNATGQDIKNGIFPLPVREPSGTLMSLLQFLVGAGERLASTTDLQVGENPGQNQKAGTTMIVQQNGLQVFTAIYKRIRKALEQEFKKLFQLNKIYLNPQEYFQIVNPSTGEMQSLDVSIDDYKADDLTVVPSADPHLASQELKMARAQYLVGLMQMGGFNDYEIKRRLLEAGDIERPEQILPSPENQPPPPPNPDLVKVQLEGIKEDNAEREREFRRQFDVTKLRVEAAAKDVELAQKDRSVVAQEIKVQGDLMNNAANTTISARQTANDAKATKDSSSGE